MLTRRDVIRTTAFAGVALAALPAGVAHSAVLADASDNSRPADLAKQILADQTLRDVLRMARTLLSSGLSAGSNYQATWIRDMNTFIQVALGVNPPQRFRDALLMFFNFQGPQGDIVDLYWPRDPAKALEPRYRTSPLAPG